MKPTIQSVDTANLKCSGVKLYADFGFYLQCYASRRLGVRYWRVDIVGSVVEVSAWCVSGGRS